MVWLLLVVLLQGNFKEVLRKDPLGEVYMNTKRASKGRQDNEKRRDEVLRKGKEKGDSEDAALRIESVGSV